MRTNTVFGLIITLKTPGYTQDTSIGLYTAGPGYPAYFRWVESTLTGGVSVPYKEGILLKGSFKSLEQSADFSYGGNVAQTAGTEAYIDNTSLFWKKLSTLGITLHGCKAEVVELVNDASVAVNTETIRLYGEVNLDSWSVSTYRIPIVSTTYQRNANILEIIDTVNYPDADESLIGTPVPATFGTFNGGRYAKLKRTANREDIAFYSKNFYTLPGTLIMFNATGLGSNGVTDYPVMTTWVAGDTVPLTYTVKLAFTGALYSQWFSGAGMVLQTGFFDVSSYFNTLYLKVTAGPMAGKYRKITNATITDCSTDSSLLNVTVADYFEEVLAGNTLANATDQAWVQFVSIARDYAGDTQPCAGFTDDAGTVLTSGFELYAYSDDAKVSIAATDVLTPIKKNPFAYLRLPDYAYSLPPFPATGSNKLSIDVKLFNNSVDDMNSFTIMPMTAPTLLNTADAATWLDSSFTRVVPGLYRNSGTVGPSYTLEAGALENMLDHDRQSMYHIKLYTDDNSKSRVAFIILFKLPPIPEGLTFDNVYFMPDIQVNQYYSVYIRTQKWFGPGIGNIDFLPANELMSLPDWYFTNPTAARYGENPATLPLKNKNFYYTGLNYYESGPSIHITGYENFSISEINDKKDYNAIDKVALISFYNIIDAVSNGDLRYYKFTVAFRKQVSVTEAIYTPILGRVFNDTWGSRKTATDLISNPIDLLEHVCRLQNFNELSINPGKQYPTTPLINTTTNWGGFDNVNLATAKTYKLSFQVFEESDGWIEKIKRDICNLCYVASYTDIDGKECVASILPGTIIPTESITLLDVPEGTTLGDVQEPSVKNIFCEPFIRYAYDTAFENFTKIMRITDVCKATYDASYTPGVPVATAQALWTACRGLYTNYTHIEQAPTEKTDMYMIYEDADAADYLTNWIYWMSRKRQELTIRYDKSGVGSWNVGHHFYLNLPHQTNGINQHCIVERIKPDNSSGLISINAVFL